MKTILKWSVGLALALVGPGLPQSLAIKTLEGEPAGDGGPVRRAMDLDQRLQFVAQRQGAARVPARSASG